MPARPRSAGQPSPPSPPRAHIPGRNRNYIELIRDARSDERIADDGACQPQFYVLGAMKAASTYLAIMLSAVPGVVVHPYEHHCV